MGEDIVHMHSENTIAYKPSRAADKRWHSIFLVTEKYKTFTFLQYAFKISIFKRN